MITILQFHWEKRPQRRRTPEGEATTPAAADQKLRAAVVRYLLRAVVPLWRKRDPDGFIRWARQMLTLVLLADVDPMALVVQEAVQEDWQFKARLKELYLEGREWEQAHQQGAGESKHEDEFTALAKEYLLQRLERAEKERTWLPILAAALAPGDALSQVVESLAASRGLSLAAPSTPTAGVAAVLADTDVNAPGLPQGDDLAPTPPQDDSACS